MHYLEIRYEYQDYLYAAAVSGMYRHCEKIKLHYIYIVDNWRILMYIIFI